MEVQFHTPSGVAVSAGGTLYVADRNNHRIRMIRNGQVTTVAGNGMSGYADGPAAEAQFSSPTGVAATADGTVYVADSGNNRIRTIRSGYVTTLAGKAPEGDVSFADGPAAQAVFSTQLGVAVSASGDVYVSDLGNHRIRMIRDGRVTTVAGKGSVPTTGGFGTVVEAIADGPTAHAVFNCPKGVAVSAGGIYVADYGNQRIRKIQNGLVTTVAGERTPFGGFGSAASTGSGVYEDGSSAGVAVGADDAVYFVDSDQNLVRMIRMGQVTTVSGKKVPRSPFTGFGRSGGFEDGPTSQAQFRFPNGIAVAADETLYIADTGNHCIRMIRDGKVSTVAGNGSPGFADGAALVQIPSFASHSAQWVKCIDVATDMSVKIGDTTLQLQRSFVSLRCPALLKSSLRLQPVDALSVTLFHRFLYTGLIPDDDLALKQLVGLAYLLFATDMKPFAFSLLDRLQRYPEAQKQSVNAQDLVEAYAYCLDLDPFDEGHMAMLYLLQKNAMQLRPHLKSVPQWLGKHADTFIDLVQDLMVPFDSLELPITAEMLAAKGNFLGLAETFEALYRTRQDADFEIVIKGGEAEMVHSFVLYAMWPYFRHMYDAGMKEKRDGRLELPAVGEDGGMSPEVLQLIIELCYKPDKLQTNADEGISAVIAMQILPIAQMYMAGDAGPEEPKYGIFTQLVDLAQAQVTGGLTLDSCFQVYQQALYYGLDRVSESAGSMIVSNIKSLMATPGRMAEFKALPATILLQLFQTCANHWG